MNFWKSYWNIRTDGGHRKTDEDFLSLEAKEKLFHLGTGNSLLDYGTGAGELVTYYSGNFQHIIGVDFSTSMLKKAVERTSAMGIKNIDFFEGDLDRVKSSVKQKFDVVTCAAVVQYFTLKDLEEFFRFSANALNEGGQICLFDIIHPVFYKAFVLGQLGPNPPKFFKSSVRRVKISLQNLIRVIRGLPSDEIGYSYNPYVILSIAEKHGLKGKVVSSMYYEYRYHLILSRT